MCNDEWLIVRFDLKITIELLLDEFLAVDLVH